MSVLLYQRPPLPPVLARLLGAVAFTDPSERVLDTVLSGFCRWSLLSPPGQEGPAVPRSPLTGGRRVRVVPDAEL